MKRYIIIILAFCLLTSNGILAQDKSTVEKPVRSPWETTTIVDFASTRNLTKGTLELMIHHRFGTFDNGISDIYGIYAPSNIRMGLDYGITSKISIGFGSEKNNKLQELRWKWNILKQTRSGSMPIDLAYFGNIVIDARDSTAFGQGFEATNRLSYFNEIIVSRKFSTKLSILAGIGYTHFNKVELFTRHDILSMHLGGRYMLWGSNSFIFEYNHPFDLNINGSDVYDEFEDIPSAGLSAGIEFGTSTHAFQVFASNYDNIMPQKNIANNGNKLDEGEFLLGFNITVRF